MDYDDHVDALRREGAALALAAAGAGLDVPVPSCPGWDVATLVRHQGVLHHWVALLCDRRPGFDPAWRAAIVPPEGGPALLEWFDAGVAAVAGRLAGLGPEVEVWSWSDQPRARFWARRMAHETAVHRCDAELARGVAPAVDAGLAVDGIDELLDLARLPTGRHTTVAGETVHLHCTDAPGEWLVTLEPDGPRVRREHAKGDAAVRGPASDLLLALHGRVGLDAVEVHGRGELVERFCEQLRH